MLAVSSFAVVVWIRENLGFPGVRDELLGLVADEPDELTEYHGVARFHWRRDDLSQAKRIVLAMAPLASRPEFAFLRLSNYEDPTSSVTFKDERCARKVA